MSEKQMHLQIERADAGHYCILPGDPGRCEAIASRLDQPRFVAQNREFTTWSGLLSGERVCVCSTGIGGPSAAIAVEELFACGVDTFVRIGTCGGIDERVCGGHAVIATAAVRQEGTGREYMPIEFPAAADFDVTTALRDGAMAAGLTFHTGIVQSKDSFYGQHSPGRMPTAPDLLYKWQAWKKAHVLASEMECAALFVVSSVLGARAGAIFNVLWNQEREKAGLTNPVMHEMEPVIDAAVEAVRLLIARDGESKKHNVQGGVK